MSRDRTPTVVTTWFGAFLFEGDALVRAAPFPSGTSALAERLARRREGGILEEERSLVAGAQGQALRSRDRRLESLGVRTALYSEPEIDPASYGFSWEQYRELLLARAAEDLAREWDPTVHIQEATRALTELDEVTNRIGERLARWAEHDRPAAPEDGGPGQRALARELLEGSPAPHHAVPGADPTLAAARQELARLYLAVDGAHTSLERALAEAVPRRAPNLCALLGPELAARMISQAGSLDRLARLPASTVQVLGAERAFFEHLRGRAPPPRHGLLFLHPTLHGAPRAQRGRLARALAGRVAIAARLDRAGRPLDPTLLAKFEARSKDIQRPRARRAPGSHPPLDRAAEHG
jgi:nucleolar protein 56